MVLHRHEAGPAVRPLQRERLHELPGPHRRGADVARFASLYDVVQRLERLLDRRARVPAVDLIEVDVVGAEPAEARVDLCHDRLARQPGAVRPRPHPSVHLGGEHNLLARDEVPERPADDLLARPARVDVRGIEEVDPGVERAADKRPALVLLQRPGVRPSCRVAIGHAAEANARHFEAGRPELGVLHRVPSVAPARGGRIARWSRCRTAQLRLARAYFPRRGELILSSPRRARPLVAPRFPVPAARAALNIRLTREHLLLPFQWLIDPCARAQALARARAKPFGRARMRQARAARLAGVLASLSVTVRRKSRNSARRSGRARPKATVACR